jgi:hypothetical protein
LELLPTFTSPADLTLEFGLTLESGLAVAFGFLAFFIAAGFPFMFIFFELSLTSPYNTRRLNKP